MCPDDPPTRSTADRLDVLLAMALAAVPLDVDAVRVPASSPPDLAHRVAAVVAVADFAATAADPADDWPDGLDPLVAPPPPGALTGRPVGLDDLLGRYWDRAKGRLLLPAGAALVSTLPLADRALAVADRRPLASGPYRCVGDDTPVWFVADPGGVPGGLSAAFLGGGSHQPLGADEEAQPLFTALLDTVLGKPGDDVEAYEWVGDFSPYFLAGPDWGEAAAWTVRTSPTEIVVLALCSTD